VLEKTAVWACFGSAQPGCVGAVWTSLPSPHVVSTRDLLLGLHMPPFCPSPKRRSALGMGHFIERYSYRCVRMALDILDSRELFPCYAGSTDRNAIWGKPAIGAKCPQKVGPTLSGNRLYGLAILADMRRHSFHLTCN